MQENLSHVDIITFISINASKQSSKKFQSLSHNQDTTIPSRHLAPEPPYPPPATQIPSNTNNNQTQTRIVCIHPLYLTVFIPNAILRSTFVNPLFYFSSFSKKKIKMPSFYDLPAEMHRIILIRCLNDRYARRPALRWALFYHVWRDIVEEFVETAVCALSEDEWVDVQMGWWTTW